MATGSAAQRRSAARGFIREMIRGGPANQDKSGGSSAMADVRVTVSLPVLKKGTATTGPTMVKHLQLMLNQRGGSPIFVEAGKFDVSTEASVKHY